MAELLASTEVTTETPLEVPLAVYMETYAPRFYEWVRGRLIPMSPTSIRHWQLQTYLQNLMFAYFGFRPIGEVFSAPIVLALDTAQTRREPDVMVALHTSGRTVTDSALHGPADICIEIVSPESVARDRGEKFQEYEQAGVREYWLIDPIHQEALFYRLNEAGRYTAGAVDADGRYRTPMLPDFSLEVGILWSEPLPDIVAIVDQARKLYSPE
jgi:Uma2 family endonuclease